MDVKGLQGGESKGEEAELLMWSRDCQQLARVALGPAQLQVGSPPKEQRIGPQLAGAGSKTMFPKHVSLASVCVVEEVLGSPAWLVTYSVGLLIPASETPALVRGRSWTMWANHGQWSPCPAWPQKVPSAAPNWSQCSCWCSSGDLDHEPL